jgi:hypothetical protein
MKTENVDNKDILKLKQLNKLGYTNYFIYLKQLSSIILELYVIRFPFSFLFNWSSFNISRP